MVTCSELEMEARIRDVISATDVPLTATDIAKAVGLHKAKDVVKTLERLRNNNDLNKQKIGRRVFWTMINPDDDSTVRDANTQCNSYNEASHSSPDIIDTLHLLIDNLQRDIIFLREQVTVKNQHIDSLLDVVEKFTSAKSGSQDNLIINPATESTEGIDICMPLNTPALNNLHTPFILPKKTSKSTIHNPESNIVLSNRFGGLWLEDGDNFNCEMENLDSYSNASGESITTNYSDTVRRNSKPSSPSNQVKHKPSTDRTSVTITQAINRRPQTVINQKPETERFDSTKHSPKPEKKQKPLVAIVGDSMTKWLTSYDIRSSCDKAKVLVRPFLGACINDLYDYIKPILKSKPQVIVLHISTNDASSKDFINTDTICEDMELLIEELNRLGIVVVLSLPINRNDEYSERLKDLNIKLRTLCSKMLVNIIDNDNIKHRHLNGSGLHLNKEGTHLLCKNIANFLDFLIPKCFLN